MAPTLPFPLESANLTLFSRARHALWWGMRAIGLVPGDEILMPAYHHGSEVEALRRAGLVCRFYEATESLDPDERELERLVTDRTRGLYLIHYLGFPQDAAGWRKWCDERGLLLLEDAAQAWLASAQEGQVGSTGHLAIFCLYKTVGLPDGAALVTEQTLRGAEGLRATSGLVALTRRHAAWLASRSAAFSLLDARSRPGESYDVARDVALGDTGIAPSRATLFLLPRLADASAARLRRGNYAALLDDAAGLPPPPFREVPRGSSPFAFPIETDRKEELLRALADSGIAGLDLWSRPHPALPARDFPGAAARRQRTVGLPVHQELRPEDLERIAAAIPRPRAHRARLVIERVTELEDLAEDWGALAETSRNIFATWEWISTWWKHFGRDRRLALAACRSGRRLVAIVPLYFWKEQPLRVLRFLGHGDGDELGPICSSGDRRAAARCLVNHLGHTRYDLFVGERLPSDDAWTVLAGRTLSREASPVLGTSGLGWEDFLKSRTSNFRQQLRRRERSLGERHHLRYRLASDPARLMEDLDLCLALHRERWSRETAFTRHEAFQREFAALALARGWLRLWFLELDGVAVAAWYGFRFAGAESYYQSGRSRVWDASAVGFVLMAHSLRAALEDGVSEYRLLRGDEPYKYRFANRDHGLETVGLSRGPLGAAALRVGSGRVPEPLRAWFRATGA